MTYVGAYLVRGSEATLDALIDRLGKERIIERGSPDLFSRSYRSFGVDDAEELRGRGRAKPVSAARRVFIIQTPSMTTEAQNALLKTLEEPSADALFFLIVPAPETLLATIRSRVQHLSLRNEGVEHVQLSVDPDELLTASPEERITMLKPLYEHDEDSGRDIGPVIAFLGALEHRFAGAQATPERTAALHAIYRARKYVTDKGSLLKILLEQVALLVPKM